MPDSPGNGLTHGLLRWLGRLIVLLLVAYPFTLHLGVLNHRLEPALGLLLGLLLLSALSLLARGNRSGWFVLASLLLAGGWIYLYRGEPQSLLKLLPVLINGALCLLFGHTLLAGQRPLISRFAEFMHGHTLDARTQAYTRGVTQVWTGLFALMALESLLLGLLAQPPLWSLFTNFINYLIVLLVFFVEYRVRLRRLAHLQHPGFLDFMLALRKIEWRSLL